MLTGWGSLLIAGIQTNRTLNGYIPTVDFHFHMHLSQPPQLFELLTLSIFLLYLLNHTV